MVGEPWGTTGSAQITPSSTWSSHEREPLPGPWNGLRPRVCKSLETVSSEASSQTSALAMVTPRTGKERGEKGRGRQGGGGAVVGEGLPWGAAAFPPPPLSSHPHLILLIPTALSDLVCGHPVSNSN